MKGMRLDFVIEKRKFHGIWMKIAELLVNSLDVYFSVAMLSYQRVNAVCSLQSTRKHGEILETSWELTMKSGTQSTTSCNQPSNIDVYSAKDGDPDLDYIIFLLTGIQPLTMPGIHIP